jgi:hypothetical protein
MAVVGQTVRRPMLHNDLHDDLAGMPATLSGIGEATTVGGPSAMQD